MQSELALIEFKGMTKSIYIPFVRLRSVLIRFIWKFRGFELREMSKFTTI